jgi:hypothetical protein
MQQHQNGRFEAAIEGAYPQRFPTLPDAQTYIKGQPVSKDGNRPWIRDTEKKDTTIRSGFLVIGGKELK